MEENPYLHQPSQKKIDELLRLPCAQCGSQLSYSAEKLALFCKHCGHTESYSKASDRIVEVDLERSDLQAQHFKPAEVGKKVMECDRCRSQLMVDTKEVSIRCNFCGSNKINEKAYEKNLIQPQGIIPFAIPKQKVVDAFRAWIQRGWFHPNALKKLAAMGDVHGIYVPFWTFDAETHTEWEGEAGYYYYETETVYENGQEKQKKVRKVRWEWRRGSFNHHFDDVLILASKGLPESVIQTIFPYRLNELVNFNPQLMVGWEAEIYSLDLKGGYRKAEVIMDNTLRNKASNQLGGDTQRGLRVYIEKYDQTYKHIVLPVWLCTYIYRNKSYQFAVNGQTGIIGGQKPVSWIKVFFALLFLAIIIGTIVYFANENQ